MRLLLLFFLYGLSSTFLHADPINSDTGTLTINWEEVNKQRGNRSARRSPYPEVLSKGISQTRLPVYLPASSVYEKNMLVVADENFYSISLPLSDATLIIMGDKSYQQTMPQTDEAQAIRQATEKIQFVREEGMMTTRFNRFGANYSMTLECSKPDEDQRCLQTGFLQNFYQELILVGGHP